jgi:hypothetical protein
MVPKREGSVAMMTEVHERHRSLCDKLWTVVKPRDGLDCASIACDEITRLRAELAKTNHYCDLIVEQRDEMGDMLRHADARVRELEAAAKAHADALARVSELEELLGAVLTVVDHSDGVHGHWLSDAEGGKSAWSEFGLVGAIPRRTLTKERTMSEVLTPTELQAVIARVGTHPDLKLTKNCWWIRERCGLGEVWRFPTDSTVTDLMMQHMQRELDKHGAYDVAQTGPDKFVVIWIACRPAGVDEKRSRQLIWDCPRGIFPTRLAATVAAVLAAFEEPSP